MNEYDVLIIGAGPGGYTCAIRASQNGLKAAIVDKKWLGGVCLNVGCVPSKALLKNAELAYTLRERAEEFGISFDNLKLDYASAVKRSRTVSQKLTRGVSFLMKKNKVDVFIGEAKVGADKKVIVTDSEGKTQQFSAKNIVIATGSTPVMPAAWQADGERVISYNEAILQEKLPKSVVIIGAGAIGAEFATVWSSYGTKVSMVEMLPNVLPLEDEEVSAELAKAYKKRGIEILTGHKVESVEKSKASVVVKVSGEGGQKSLEAEQALVAIGFRPNSAGLGLEELGVKMDGKGFVQVDDKLASSVPGIWAIGDVTGKVLLAHVASAQAVLCADALAGKKTAPLNYQNIPHATYCQPQVASFGLSEAQAKASGKEIKVGRFPFQANGKALGLGETTGFIKIISDAKYGEILGAHMIGPEVSELLPELTLAQQMELTSEEIAHNIHAHPTLSEVILEAAEAIEGQSINI
jgi:dihydrolipoamide dehydrogenase